MSRDRDPTQPDTGSWTARKIVMRMMRIQVQDPIACTVTSSLLFVDGSRSCFTRRSSPVAGNVAPNFCKLPKCAALLDGSRASGIHRSQLLPGNRPQTSRMNASTCLKRSAVDSVAVQRQGSEKNHSHEDVSHQITETTGRRSFLASNSRYREMFSESAHA